MTRATWLRPASTLTVMAVVASGLFAAWTAHGYEVPKFDLHDGGVWVSKSALQQVGRLNPALDLVDARLATASVDFEIYQSGPTVVVHDRAAGLLRPVDVRLATLGAEVEVGPGATVGIGGTTGAVLRKGKVWVVPGDLLGSTDLSERPPALEIDGDGALAVGVDGIVHVVALKAGEVIRLDGDGAELDRRPLGADGVDAVQVSAVGERTVVLDTGGKRLLVPGGSPVDLASLGEGLVLQQPGPANEAGALVAGNTSLAAVSLVSSTPTVLAEGGGAPAAPVFVAGCGYAAWSGSGALAKACPGRDAVVHPLGPFAGPLQFRVNRGRAVLNDLRDGVSWLFTDGEPRRVDDWSQALNSDEQESEIDSGRTEAVEEPVKVLDRSAANRPPVAVDDDAAARAGRPTVVEPLANDSDPDGDVLLLTLPVPLADTEGVLEPIDGGAALQYTPPPGRTEPVAFDYEVTDGRGGKDTGRVMLAIRPEGENGAPVTKVDRTVVEAGKSVDHDVVANDTDPDGDAVSLVGVAVEPGKGTVQHRTDGLVTFTAAGGVVGDVVLPYQVVDEYGAGGVGQLVVNVRPPGNLAPTARNDRAVTIAGREVVLDVLSNDSDPNGDPLSVVRVQERSDATTSWTPQGQLRFRADRASSYDLLYAISDGTAVDEALIRVEVLASGERHPPVAVRDDAVVRPGVATLVAPLANDIDLDGDVLVLQRVANVPPSLVVEVLKRQFLRISVVEPLPGPLTFNYLVTDGGLQATGAVVVRAAPPAAVNQAPVANPDEISVRAGNVTRIDVLANDSDPDGEELSLVAVDELAPGDGIAFVQGKELRYQAPGAERGAITVRYTVVDEAGNKAAGTVTVHVTPPDPTRNRPPEPRSLEARVFSGREVTVEVPLVGTDPDGDAITLLGVAEPPALGEIVRVGADALVYRAFDDAVGTDRFTYRVRDQFGAEATGTVLVGIAPLPDVNSPPVAVPDAAGVRPGAEARIRVLDNDSDPDDDEVSIADIDDAIGVPRVGTASLGQDGVTVLFRAPAGAAGAASFDYAITDGRGTLVRGLVTMTISDEARPLAPLARDDVVPPQQPGATVVVDVLANDSDPDGAVEDLKVSADPASGAEVSGGKVSLVMPDRAVSLVYTITDGDGLTARAFVLVPVTSDLPPVVGLDEAETSVNAAVSIDVLANDRDPEGAPLHLIRVVTTRSGSAEVDGGSVRFTPSPDFAGAAGFTYEVSDKPDGQNGNVAVGTASVMVTGSVNSPPAVTRLALDVPAGGERSVDLRSVARDPDGDDLSFSDLADPPRGLRARITGAVLLVSADDATPKGTGVSLSYTVDDGSPGGRVEANAEVTVVGSDKPRPQAVADAAETNQGAAVTVDVVANDLDPLGKGLTVTIANPSPSGRATVSGTSITFAPDPEFFGSTAVGYAIADATNDPDRTAIGTVAVTVYGRPSAPPSPAGTVDNKAIGLSWGAPAANGAPIQHYLVRWQGGQKECPANACRIDGLVNGTAYRFTVVAVNRAGEGPPSSPSTDLTPDALPAVPGAPTATFGDRQVVVAWQAPANEGTPIDHYIVQVSPPPTNGVQTQRVTAGVGSMTHTWAGLTNGTAYSFRVRAHNDAGDTEYGPTSNPEIPAGPPSGPAAPTAVRNDARLVVSWTEPESNGDAVTAYELLPSRDGADQPAVAVNDPAQRSLSFPAENGQSYTFKLRARNKAGWSSWSPASAAVVPAGVPLTVGSVTAADGDRQALLTFTNPGSNGAAITRYEVSTSNGPATTLAASRVVSPLTNGTNYTFRVRACNDVGCAQWSPASNQVTPFGPPSAPGVSSSVNNTTITWSWSEPSGNGRPITGYEFQIDGGGFQSTGSRSHAQGFTWNETHTLCVRAVNSGGLRSTSACKSDTTASPPVYPQQQGTYGANTFTNPYNASGMGVKIAAMAWVDVSCKVHAPQIASANPDGYWYRIASSPWNNQYYAVANTFWNGDTPGQTPYTRYTDFSVPDC